MSFLLTTINKQISLPPSLATEIESKFEEIDLPRKGLLVKAGEIANKLALIESGYLRMYSTDSNGKETTVWMGGRGKFITAISSFVDRKPSYWNVEALTDSKLHTIKVDSHFQLCHDYREWLDFENLLLTRALSALEYRTFELISMKAEMRVKAFMERNADLFLNVPSKYIASLLGISEETLSRLKKSS